MNDMNQANNADTVPTERTTFQVLVVDDEHSVLETYANILHDAVQWKEDRGEMESLEESLFGSSRSRSGRLPYEFDLHCCTQGDQAVREIQSSSEANGRIPFAVAFVDVRMPPGPDGIWTAGWIRSLSPETYIVIVTAYGDVDPVDVAEKIPPRDKLFYIQKPFHSKELRQFTSALCSRWLAERQLREAYVDLEQRIRDRSGDLAAAREKLRREQDERARAESELFETRHLMENAFESLSDGLCVMDTVKPAIVMCNGALTKIFGHGREDLIGRSPAMLFPDRDAFRAFFAAALAQMDEATPYRAETPMRRRDGSLFACEHTVAEVQGLGGRRIAVVSLLRDVTLRKRLERKVLEIEDEERRRIGRDLHDGLGQLLTGLAFKCGSFEKRLAAGAPGFAEAAGELTRLVNGAINEVRGIAKGMSPCAVSQSDLGASLQDLARSLTDMFGIQISFSMKESISVGDKAVVTHLYRIAQEAATNALRHATPEHVKISVGREGELLCLRVTDDGSRGWEVNEGAGIGIHIMRQRASFIGGELRIHQPAEGGTEISCCIPVREIDKPGPAGNE